MKYHYNKLKSELDDLKKYYEALRATWSVPDDYEDLYRIRIPLLVIATLLRVVGGDKNTVSVLRDIKYNQNPRDLMFTVKDISSLIFADDFRNKIKLFLPLEDICNYLIHEKGSGYLDNRHSYEQKDGFHIYYSVYTDHREEIAIDIDSFIESVETVLSKQS